MLIHRKRDDLADVRLAGEQHHDPVDPRRRAAVRRRAVLERVQHAAEPGLHLLAPVSGERERLVHDIRAVVADRAARELDAVADDVVLIGLDRQRIGALQRLEPALRHRERVVAELDLLGVLVQLVHREVGHPAEAERVGLDEPELLAEANPDPARELLGNRLLVADEEHRVALAGSGGRHEPTEPVPVEELRERPLRAAVAEDHVPEPRRPLVACPLPELVEEAPRLRRGARRRHRADDGPRLHRRRECREARAAEDVGHVGDQDWIAQIGLVASVLRHRLIERDPRERRRRHHGAAGELLEDAVEDRLDRREDVFLRDEGHLEVELIELAR